MSYFTNTTGNKNYLLQFINRQEYFKLKIKIENHINIISDIYHYLPVTNFSSQIQNT